MTYGHNEYSYPPSVPAGGVWCNSHRQRAKRVIAQQNETGLEGLLLQLQMSALTEHRPSVGGPYSHL
jgi:hypothetical protein